MLTVRTKAVIRGEILQGTLDQVRTVRKTGVATLRILLTVSLIVPYFPKTIPDSSEVEQGFLEQTISLHL